MSVCVGLFCINCSEGVVVGVRGALGIQKRGCFLHYLETPSKLDVGIYLVYAVEQDVDLVHLK